MAQGFIFNHDKCTGCKACIAACVLENRWTFVPRTVFSLNPDAGSSLPVVNISLACNHCKKAVCLEGCPASAYFRDPVTDAVIIDVEKCIGCRYCQWNCPYDAPKYHSTSGVIGKCNFCFSLLQKELSPACTEACPTGALSYGNLSATGTVKPVSWFPEKDLEPALEMKGQTPRRLRIFPVNLFEDEQQKSIPGIPVVTPEWSLTGFSFLSIMSVANIISTLITGSFPGRFRFIVMIVMAGLLSLFHLGKKSGAWRAVVNFKSSPLSREIVIFLLYTLFSVTTVMIQLPLLLIVSTISGLVLLMAIDRVYIFSDKRKSVFFHSGQAFLTGLLIASFITGMRMPFAFIAVLKLAAAITGMIADRNNSLTYTIRFTRAALLVITGASFMASTTQPENSVLILFLTGELVDRILFYIDFKPLSISRLIDNQNIRQEYEKERD